MEAIDKIFGYILYGATLALLISNIYVRIRIRVGRFLWEKFKLDWQWIKDDFHPYWKSKWEFGLQVSNFVLLLAFCIILFKDMENIFKFITGG